MGQKIVVIDDSRFVVVFVKKALAENPDYEVITFTDAPAALDFIEQARDLALICTDLNMPDVDGFAVIRRLKELAIAAPIIVITGSSELDDALRAIRAGAFDYIVKPIDKEHLCVSVDRAVKMFQLEKQNKEYTALLESINDKNQKELEMGSRIQQHMMPQAFPDLQHFKFGSKYVPSNSIGGDFFDLINYADLNLTGIFFLDVTGHGIPAALLTIFVKSQISITCQHPERLSEELRELNQLLNDALPPGKFASTFFLIIDDTDKKISFSKCSQEPGLLFKRDGTVVELKSDGILLGSFDNDFLGDDFTFAVKELGLEAGDRIVLYTDGLTEAANRSGEMFSTERMVELIKRASGVAPQDVCDNIYAEVTAFTGTTDLEDDFTIMVIDVH